jgi:hypothetical protein
VGTQITSAYAAASGAKASPPALPPPPKFTPAAPPATPGAATTAQPFYTSKTFWTLLLAFAGNILVQTNVLPVTADFQTYSNMAMLILAGIFRWTADQPLSVTGTAPPTAMPAAIAKD